MRKPLRSNPSKAAIVYTASIPAPTGGWDTESPLSKMPLKNAVILDNWIPRSAKCELRRGHIDQITGMASPVEELIVWSGAASGDKLFACSGANIYDVTAHGSLGAPVHTLATSPHWESTNFANDAGGFAICANGFDTPIAYNGSAFVNLTITGTSGPITLNPATLRGPMTHKRRLWFIQKNSLRVWFLDTNAIQGAARLLDLGPLFDAGGYIQAQGTWSLDNGAGMDDVAVFITSEGQVAVYQGLDPTDANQWSLVGVYSIAKPVSAKCLLKWGADLVVITQDGIVPLSQALQKNRDEARKTAITAKVASAFSNAAASYGGNYGWDAVTYSGRGALAIINVPTAALSTAVQYVQSIESGSWCRFTGLNAICWATANDMIYFGAATGVFRWDIGASDNGATITGDVKSAFSDFGRAAQTKHFTMIRPLMKCPSIIAPALEMLVEYQEAVPTAVATVVQPGDIAAEDVDVIRGDWTGASGIGYVGAPRMQVAITADVAGTDRLATDAPLLDLLVDQPAGGHILLSPNLPLDVNVELIGFNIMFQLGGQL